MPSQGGEHGARPRDVGAIEIRLEQLQVVLLLSPVEIDTQLQNANALLFVDIIGDCRLRRRSRARHGRHIDTGRSQFTGETIPELIPAIGLSGLC